MFTTNSTSPTEPRRRGTSQSPSAGGNSASPGFVQSSHIHNNVVGEDGRPSKSPEQCLKEDQSAAKRAKERDIKKFMEWLDDLDTDGVVHALDLFGVSEEAREAVEESDVDGETWAALFSQKLDRYMISDMMETYKLKKEDVIMFKRKFGAYYPQHDSREVKVTDKVAPDLEFEANDGISMFRSWTAYFDEVINWLHTNDESWCELGKRVLFNNREHVSTHDAQKRMKVVLCPRKAQLTMGR